MLSSIHSTKCIDSFTDVGKAVNNQSLNICLALHHNYRLYQRRSLVLL